jgi:hypothetical protein
MLSLPPVVALVAGTKVHLTQPPLVRAGLLVPTALTGIMGTQA